MQSQASVYRPGEKTRVLGWVGLGVVTVSIGAALWLRGAEFYGLDAAARVDHADYRILSPGYPLGHAYGFIASALVVANLTYLLRRRIPSLKVGSMRAWLNIHVATGLLSGLFALSHSALQFRNPMALITMVALAITLVSGIIGRFIFLFVPVPDPTRLAANCTALDVISPGLGGELYKQLEQAPVPTVPGRVTLLKVLFLLPSWGRIVRSRRRLVRQALVPYAQIRSAELQLLSGLISETEKLAAGVPKATAYGYLMRSWRGMHRFFALLMIVLMIVHASVAWYYGYRWIFSEPVAY